MAKKKKRLGHRFTGSTPLQFSPGGQVSLVHRDQDAEGAGQGVKSLTLDEAITRYTVLGKSTN